MIAPPLPSQLTFADGLVGLPALRSFHVTPGRGGLVELDSVDEPGFGLLAIGAEIVRDDYRDQLVEAGLVGEGEALYVVLSVHGDPASVTANLAGPLAVGEDGAARQLVVGLPGFDVRAPVTGGG